jgi:hypothetical protein
MDKQEAIDFVLDELDKGRSPAEITAALSRRLGAPIDLVSKFVRQTSLRYQQSKAALGEPLATSQKQSAPSQKPLASSQPPSAFSQPPPAASQKPAAISQKPLAPSQQPAAIGLQPPAASQQPIAASHEPIASGQPPAAYKAQMAAEEAIPLPNAEYTMPAEQTPRRAEREAAISPELEKYILDELGKNKREGDVVLGVVERTGMEYREAQRMVSRVGARNYKKVTARQNCLIIPLAVIALVAGLVLLGASVIEAYQIRFLLPSPNDLNLEQVQAAVQRGRELPWAFVTGLALSLGGGIGLIGAIRKQME